MKDSLDGTQRKKSHNFLESCRYAWRGVRVAFSAEQNIRIQVAWLVVALGLAWFFEMDWLAVIVILLVSGLVLTLEMVNSAVELLADVAMPQRDDRVRDLKDMMAGAVLLASFGAVLIGIILFVPELLELVY